jgi:CheY-like chemotaxis protein
MTIPKSILLIEDNSHDQFFFLQALKNIEDAFLLDMACNGKEAIDKLESAVILPDLIFTDIHMPVMDGIECLTELRSNPLTQSIPVVVLSTDISHIDRLREIGANAFIKKPSNCEILRERIMEMIYLDFSRDRDLASHTFLTALS